MKVFLPAIVLLAAAVAVPAHAGDVELQVANGRVTLQARDAYVRDILAEWARVGEVKVVNGDRVMSQPVTLDLQDVPEAQALTVILRSVSGFMASPREQPAGDNASIYERIVIMPAPRPAPANASFTPQPSQQPPPYRGMPQPGMVNPAYMDDQDQPAGNSPFPGNQPPMQALPRGMMQPQPQTQPPPGQLPTGAPGTLSPMPQAQPGGSVVQPSTGAPGTISGPQPVKNPGGPGGDGGNQ